MALPTTTTKQEGYFATSGNGGHTGTPMIPPAQAARVTTPSATDKAIVKAGNGGYMGALATPF